MGTVWTVIDIDTYRHVIGFLSARSGDMAKEIY